MGLKVERERGGREKICITRVVDADPGQTGSGLFGGIWVVAAGGAVYFDKTGGDVPMCYSTDELRNGEYEFIPDDRIEVTITIRE